MSEKIAVHCPTQELWDKVQDKALLTKKWPRGSRGEYSPLSPCLNLAKKYLDKCENSFYERSGYTIISAEEYLNEREFKVGDRVECIDEGDRSSIKNGIIYTISDIVSGGRSIRLENQAIGFQPDRFKLANHQTKTTKKEESNMNSNIARVYEKTSDAVLVERYCGGELDEGVYDYVILSTHKDEFLKEAKRLDKEAKEASKK